MKILYLTPGCFDKGGISRYSRYQISALRQICGAENVRVLSLLGPDDDAFEGTFPVSWHGSSRPDRVSVADRIKLGALTLGAAATWRPDIVHSAHVNFGPLLTSAARLSRAKTLLNVYGLEIWSGLNSKRRASMAGMASIIADCHFTARYVVEDGLHRDLPTVIWDPVDLNRFSPGQVDPEILTKYAIPDPTRHFIVMSLGRLSKAAAHKGFDRLIDLAATVTPEIPKIRFVIAGRGDDRQRLEALAAERGVLDRVCFIGSIEEADLPAVYRCAHIFSLVSDRGHARGEGIPLTPLEAMACGVPIIVGDEDGSKEAVFNGRNGFVVSPHNQHEQHDLLMQLTHNRILQKQLSEQARKVAEEHFGFERFVEKHRIYLHDIKRATPTTVT